MIREIIEKIRPYLLQFLVGALAYHLVATKYLYRVFYYGFPGLFFKGNAFLEQFGIVIPRYVPFEKSSFIVYSIIQPVYFILIIPFILAFFFTYKLRWNDFEFVKELKVLYCVIAGLATVTSVFYGFNYYFDQAHTIDRLIILTLFGASLVRPAYSLFFVLFAFTSWSQGNYLLGNNSITDERISFDILIAVVIFIVGSRFYKIKMSVLIVFISAVFLSSYYYSGLEKINISPSYYNWAIENETWVGVFNMMKFGWVNPLNPSNNIAFYKLFNTLQPYIGVIVVILELSVLFIFLNRKLSISLLVLILFFHLTVFILLGLFFIKWFVIANFFIWLLIKGDKILLHELFSKQILVISILFLLLINYVYAPSRLSWWDTRLSNHYEFYVKSDSQELRRFPINIFAPYDKDIGFGRLHFMFDRPFLVVGDGTSDYTLHNSLKELKYIQSADSIENRYFDSNRKKVFIGFFQKYFSNRNKHKSANFWEMLTFPRHVWAHYKGESDYSLINQLTIVLKEDYVTSFAKSLELHSDSIKINIDNK